MHLVIGFEKDQIGCTLGWGYFSRSNKGDISSFIDHSFTLLSHHFSPKITLAEHNSTGCLISKCANVNGSERSIIIQIYFSPSCHNSTYPSTPRPQSFTLARFNMRHPVVLNGQKTRLKTFKISISCPWFHIVESTIYLPDWELSSFFNL